MIFRNRNLWAAREEVGASGHPSPFSQTDTVLRMYKFKLRAAQGRPLGFLQPVLRRQGSLSCYLPLVPTQQPEFLDTETPGENSDLAG